MILVFVIISGVLCSVSGSQETDLLKLNCSEINAVQCPIPLLYQLRLNYWAQGNFPGRRLQNDENIDTLSPTEPSPIKLIDSIVMEEPCSRAGGQCVLASDCPAGHLVETAGLCPNQQPRGIECCYGQSVKESRCHKLGVCIPKSSFCNEKLIFDQAKDCLEDEKCCIMTI